MALIKCSECSAEISDKASCCPKCGAPVIVHKWRCSTCGNMISEDPCPYCSNMYRFVGYAHTKNNEVCSAAPSFTAKNKKNRDFLILLLTVITIALIVFISALRNGEQSNSNAPDPNRTQESCSFLGVADVYPASHCNGNCHSDGDGYYWPSFGHHHHK